MNSSPVYPLSSACAESIFAAFHDPIIAPSLDVQLKKLSVAQCEINYFWCYTNLVWEVSEAGIEATEFLLKTKVDISNYDKLILCLAVPKNIDFSIAFRVDEEWLFHDKKYHGTGTRDEILLPLSGSELTDVKIKFISNCIGHDVVHLSWFGVQDTALVEEIIDSQKKFHWNWKKLIIEPEEWLEIKFEKELLFSPDILQELRIKKNLPGWDAHYKLLESEANKYLMRSPEQDLGEYLPLNDFRYIRERERGKTPYHSEALVLGFVGLINNNKKMMYHALRYLCCMLHTRYWVQSAESKLSGSTWDQRCFMEEMTTTSVVLLADWFSFALTEQAKELVRQCIWDKGLATIERDMMKYDYLYHCNQGIGFCRARILGGLYLQDTWPRMGTYVERAYTDMTKILDKYVHADGGIDEGVGYFGQSFQGALPGIIANARYQGQDFRKILKAKFKKTIKYVSALASTEYGKAIPVGDCRTEYFCGDVIPIMAALFPDSAFGGILKPCIEKGSIFSLTGMMTNSGGILGFIYGPDKIQEARCVVPEFAQLPNTGVLSSYRRKGIHSVRVFLQGSQPNPSHSHFDKGSIVVEIDGLPILVDRGMVSYADTEAAKLAYSLFHNVLTPVLKGKIYPNQDVPSNSIIPKGRGTKKMLSSTIDLTNVWRSYMQNYSRSIKSKNIEQLTVNDTGVLNTPGQIAFHLHSVYPFEEISKNIKVRTEVFDLNITADWADSVNYEQKSIDLKGRAIYTLIISSGMKKDFNLNTYFDIKYHG